MNEIMAMSVKYDISIYARFHSSFPRFIEVCVLIFIVTRLKIVFLSILTSRRRVKSKMTEKWKLQVFYIKHRAGAIK